MQQFSFKRVSPTDAAVMEQIYQLRFQVYCRECGYIREEDYASGMEMDEYDPYSLHFAALNAEEQVVGSTRLILTDRYMSPLQKHCPYIPPQCDILPGGFAEISRLIISKKMRGYLKGRDRADFNPLQNDESDNHFMRQAAIIFGLYELLYEESRARGITHWCALMEKGLWLLLRIYGFKMHCVGSDVNIFGVVRPYIAKVEDIIQPITLQHRLTFLNGDAYPSPKPLVVA